MNKKGLVVGAVVFAAIGWFGNQVFGPKEKPREAVAVEDPAVAVGVAETVEFNPVTEYVGHVEPIQETDILPQIEGYVKKVCFAEGAYVRAGDILFEIDPEQYEASRNLRYSEVRSAEAKVTVAAAEVDRAERYFKRLESADDRGVTATERDTAETTLASAKAALNAAQAEVEQAKAAAAIADFNLKHTVGGTLKGTATDGKLVVTTTNPGTGLLGVAFQNENGGTATLKLTTTGAWTVDAADLVAGKAVIIPGELTFGPAATLTITGDVTQLDHKARYTILETTAGSFAGLPTLANSDLKGWSLRRVGGILRFSYSNGLIVIVR